MAIASFVALRRTHGSMACVLRTEFDGPCVSVAFRSWVCDTQRLRHVRYGRKIQQWSKAQWASTGQSNHVALGDKLAPKPKIFLVACRGWSFSKLVVPGVVARLPCQRCNSPLGQPDASDCRSESCTARWAKGTCFRTN